MKRERGLIFWTTGGLASGLLAASVWAQSPVAPNGPAPSAAREPEGPLRRKLHHAGRTLQEQFIGYPQEFVEPPAGAYVREAYGVMKSKASPHKFTFYRSDFLEGNARFSPAGASRFNRMAPRISGWMGPVVIEWSPDQPGLAEMRRAAVLAMLERAGRPVIAERVVIGPSPYPGTMGTDAANNFNAMIARDAAAPAAFSLTPSSGGGFGGGTP